MRRLPVRRIATTTVCAALVLGIAGPAAVAADHERTRTTVQEPVPEAAALLTQNQSLAGLGIVLTPVTDLLDAVLKADNGQLSSADAARLGDAAKESIAKVQEAAPAAQPAAGLPQAPAAPAVPAVPSTPAKPADPVVLPALPGIAQSDAKAPAADLTDDALAALQQAIDKLIDAATSGKVDDIVSEVTAAVTGLVNLLTATLLGGGLPAPDLAGLPALPSLPAAAPAVPSSPAATPALPSLPAATPAAPEAPAASPALPATGLLPTS
ncbi:hypothetical protein ACWC10_08795 [Streptomyces sp. NPDC001595]|uniref:hypothetical protein n=1 Tax=Streptomyces sp. NPDC001532 TaxID=3154520 RepID=UPI00331DBDF1